MVEQRPLSEAKRRLIETLKHGGPVTAVELAACLELTDVAVRQHLAALEAASLVERVAPEPPAGNRGRPASRWRLTGLADELFPDRHVDLALEILDVVRRTSCEAGVQDLIDQRGRDQVARYRRHLPAVTAPLRRRLQALARLRTEEGYMAEVLRDEDGYVLIERHCPICEAARSCQGLCRGELEVFRQVLGRRVHIEREEHILRGDRRCAYRVTER